MTDTTATSAVTTTLLTTLYVPLVRFISQFYRLYCKINANS